MSTIKSDIKEKFLAMRAIKYWNRLPEEVLDSPSLEVWDDLDRDNTALSRGLK